MSKEIPTPIASDLPVDPTSDAAPPRRSALGVLFRNKMFRVSGVYVMGSVIQQASNFLLIPLWTRFLTPADYGIMGTLSAIGGLLGHLVGLGLQSSANRFHFDHLDDEPRQRRIYMGLWAFQGVFGMVFSLLILGIGFFVWAPSMGTTIPFMPFVPLMLVTVLCTSMINLPIMVLQTRQLAGAYVAVQYGRFLLVTAMGVLLVVLLHQGAVGWVISQAAAAFLASILVGIYFIKKLSARPFEWSIVGAGLRYSLPLLPHCLAGWVMMASDRVIMTFYDFPLTEIGLYTVGYTMGMAMFSVVSGVGQAWGPKYMEIMTREPETAERKIARVWAYYAMGVGSLCMFAILFCPMVVRLILPEKYHQASIYSGPIFFTYLLQGLYYFAGSPLFFHKATHLVPVATVFAALVNIGLNLILLRTFGLMVAVWTTVAADLLLLSLVFVLGRRFQKISFPYKKLACFLALLPACYLLMSNKGECNLIEIASRLTLLAGFAALGFILFLPDELKRLAQRWRSRNA